jgi:two-component system nitrate/nitrite response regulator NarL
MAGGIDDAEIRCLIRRLVAVLTHGCPTVTRTGSDQLLDVEVDGVRCILTVQPEPTSGDGVVLSPREAEIGRMVVAGYTNQAIADALGISAWTVSTHLRRIFGKLGVNSRTAMVARLVDGDRPLPGARRDRYGVSPSRVRATRVRVSPEDAWSPRTTTP